MAGQVSQSESDVIYKRLVNVSLNLLDIHEEIARLTSMNTSVDLSTNLDPESGGNLTKAQAVSLFSELKKYQNWFTNKTQASSGAEESTTRRTAIDPFILVSPLV